MNSSGAIRPRSGWRQRTSASAPQISPRRDVDQRLIVQLEFAPRQRVAQVDLERAARPRLGVHLRLEEAIAVAAFGFGAIEREVGVLEQFGRRRRRRPARARCRCWCRSRSDGRRSRRARTDRSMQALRRARSLPAAGRSSAGCRIANSSPPSRPTVSPRTDAAAQALATALSSASPIGWPSESLTALNRSRSKHEHGEARRRCGEAARAPRPSSRGTARGWRDRSARRGAPCARCAPRCAGAR